MHMDTLLQQDGAFWQVKQHRVVLPEAMSGRMEGGTVTNGTAVDLQLAEAYRCSGGFAGEMLTGSVANTGDVSLAGLKIIGADSLVDSKPLCQS